MGSVSISILSSKDTSSEFSSISCNENSIALSFNETGFTSPSSSSSTKTNSNTGNPNNNSNPWIRRNINDCELPINDESSSKCGKSKLNECNDKEANNANESSSSSTLDATNEQLANNANKPNKYDHFFSIGSSVSVPLMTNAKTNPNANNSNNNILINSGCTMNNSANNSNHSKVTFDPKLEYI
jgi:hypothetical protein